MNFICNFACNVVVITLVIFQNLVIISMPEEDYMSGIKEGLPLNCTVIETESYCKYCDCVNVQHDC